MILQQINEEFKAALNEKDQVKMNMLLVGLMNRLEKLGVPAMNNEQYNRNHPEVIELYRKISNARNILFD